MASIDVYSYSHGTSAPRRIRQAWLTMIMARVGLWRQLRRERQQLSGLSDSMLKDIGLTRMDVERESSRPFWDTDGLSGRHC